MSEPTYNVIVPEKGVPIKAWTKGVPLEDQARQQLLNVAQLPFIFKWVAAMPDVHWGIGATVGSVIPTKGAIIPAAVGVDIGCGMMAVQTDLNARELPDNLRRIRSAIEKEEQSRYYPFDAALAAGRETLFTGDGIRSLTRMSIA
jgi:tRNA-splicing ligase RtcB